MFRLTKKVAVITGGASGIGLEISRAFARQGAIVHIFELNIDLAEREADLINANGGKAYCHKVDVPNQTDVLKKMAKINAMGSDSFRLGTMVSCPRKQIDSQFFAGSCKNWTYCYTFEVR